MSIKLVASDLDGTMVGDNNIISNSNFEAIKELNSKNINLAICTGKTYEISKSYCKEFNAKYGIFNNGSQIYDLTTGNKIYSLSLTNDEISKCIFFSKENNLHVHVYSDNELITEKLQYLDLRNFKLLDHSNYKFVIIDDILGYIQKNQVEINQLVISGPQISNQFKELISTSLNVSIDHISKTGVYKDKIINKEYEYLSIVPGNTNKNTAIKFLEKYLNVDSSEIMAIGDNLNDLEMVKNSGIGVAVSNAYTDLKGVAKYVTQNDASSGGFAEAVFKFIK